MDNKIPSFSGLATNAALTAAENEIPSISSLVLYLLKIKWKG